MRGLFGRRRELLRDPRGRRRAGRRSQRGFTLLELLITLSVTTIGLIGLLALHLSIVRGNDGASRAAEAEQITASELELLRAQSPRTMMWTLTGNPDTPPPVTAVPFIVQRNGRSYSVTQSVTAPSAASPNLWRIRVVTRWAENGAAIGSDGDPFNHSIALEVIRTIEEQL